MTLVNLRTGHEEVFVVGDESYRDGELVSWTLLPVGLALRNRFGGCSILLFND